MPLFNYYWIFSQKPDPKYSTLNLEVLDIVIFPILCTLAFFIVHGSIIYLISVYMHSSCLNTQASQNIRIPAKFF